MENEKPYRIIEPRLIDPLMVKTKYHEYAVLIFHWLIKEIYVELKDELDGIEIDVIKIVYIGKYPALGLQTASVNRGLEKLIETTANRLLQERTIIDLINFVSESNIDWKHKTNEIME